MPGAFITRNKNVMDLDGEGSKEKLPGIGGGKIVIMIYCVKKSIVSKRKMRTCMRATLVCY